jgi:SNF2 family DNA or RNA helicase
MTFQPKAPVFADERTKSLVVNAWDPFELRDLIPDSRTIDHPDWNVAVKWTDDSAQLLRNMGFDAPFRPRHWPGIYQPLPHQLDMINFQLLHRKCFNLSEMGTMKTAPALWTADLLMKRGEVKKVLIVTPLSTMETVWQQGIFDTCMHRTCVIVHGDEQHRRNMLAADVDFYIINHDAMKIVWLKNYLRKRMDIQMVIVDEGGDFRNAGTEKYKGLDYIIRNDQRLIWMTGTPCPNEPVDAWSQCRIVNPAMVPAHVGTFKRMTMYKQSQFKWVKLKGAEQTVFKAMQPAIRFQKKDLNLNLPPVTTIKFSANLSKEQLDAYGTMKRAMIADIGTKTISAVHAADQIGKLRQILCGVVKSADGSYLPLDFHPRLKVLRQIIESSSSKVVVIVPFKGILEALAKELEKPVPGGKTIKVGILNGDVSRKRRVEIITDFKHAEYPNVLLCHPKVMSHGLNLTEADITAFWAPIYSNDQFEQVIERFNRMGQKHKMTIARIGAHPMEWAVYRLIDDRRLSQATILDLYRQIAGRKAA